MKNARNPFFSLDVTYVWGFSLFEQYGEFEKCDTSRMLSLRITFLKNP